MGAIESAVATLEQTASSGQDAAELKTHRDHLLGSIGLLRRDLAAAEQQWEDSYAGLQEEAKEGLRLLRARLEAEREA